MCVIARLYGNREKQKEWHRELREPVKALIDERVIERFVMTYHGSKLYLCLDSPELTEETLEHFMSADSFIPITDYLTVSVEKERIKVSNYEVEVQNSMFNRLTANGFENPSDTFPSELARREIDNA